VADLAAHHRLDRLGHPLSGPFDGFDLDSEVDRERGSGCPFPAYGPWCGGRRFPPASAPAGSSSARWAPRRRRPRRRAPRPGRSPL
jgi:hypothetical protein